MSAVIQQAELTDGEDYQSVLVYRFISRHVSFFSQLSAVAVAVGSRPIIAPVAGLSFDRRSNRASINCSFQSFSNQSE